MRDIVTENKVQIVELPKVKLQIGGRASGKSALREELLRQAYLEYLAKGRVVIDCSTGAWGSVRHEIDGQTYWIDEWHDIKPAAFTVADFRDQYMCRPSPSPWVDVAPIVKSMVERGYGRSTIRRALLAHYPSMKNSDVNYVLHKYEEKNGEIPHNSRVR
jgi:hypothetical protein